MNNVRSSISRAKILSLPLSNIGNYYGVFFWKVFVALPRKLLIIWVCILRILSWSQPRIPAVVLLPLPDRGTWIARCWVERSTWIDQNMLLLNQEEYNGFLFRTSLWGNANGAIDILLIAHHNLTGHFSRIVQRTTPESFGIFQIL